MNALLSARWGLFAGVLIWGCLAGGRAAALEGGGSDNAVTLPSFACLPCEDPVTAFTLTEDGAFLVVSHHATDSVTVWNAATGTLVRKIPCPAAGCILARGEKIYVANQGKSTISVFSQRSGMLENQFKVDDPTIIQLSAPGGTHFAGQLLVTLGGSERPRDLHRAELIDLRTEKPVNLVACCSSAAFNHRGDFVVISDNNTGLTYETSLASLMPKVPFQPRPGAVAPMPQNNAPPQHPISLGGRIPAFLSQTQDGPWWCGADSIYGEQPLGAFQPFVVDRSEIPPQMAMDQRDRTAYAITEKGISAYRLDSMKATVTWRILQAKQQNPMETDLDWILATPPQVVTTDGKVHVYIRGLITGTVYVAHLDAKGQAVLAAPPTPSTAPAAGPGHPMPAGHDANTGASGGPTVSGTGATLAGVAPSAFTMIPADEPADGFTLSEDGIQLALLHRDSNCITLWDVAARAVVRSIPCPAPGAIVWRGHQAYVANEGAATITVFDTATWAQVDQLKAPGPHVLWLSAARGAAFDGRIYATIGEQLQHCTFFQIDLRTDASVEIKTWTTFAGDGFISVSANGKAALTSDNFFHRDSPQSPFVAANADMLPAMTQTIDGPFWVSHDGFFMNLPPVQLALSPLQTQEGGFMPQVAMDQAGHSFYRICQDHVEAYGCKVDMPRLGSWPITLPVSETTPQSGRYELPSFPQAVTIGGIAHIFICSRITGGVLTADLRAATAP